MVRFGLVAALLYSSCCMAFDLDQATKPPPPPAEVAPEKTQFEFHTKEDVIAAFSSGDARSYLRFFDVIGAPDLTSDGRLNIMRHDKNLRAVLVNSYGLDSAITDLVGACQKFDYYHLRDGSPFYRNLKLLGESVSYNKRHNLGEVLGYEASFTGEYPDEPAKREKFRADFDIIAQGCSGSEAADAVLTAYKAYLQDVGTAMEAFVTPHREALKVSVAAYNEKKQAYDSKKAGQAQCKQTPAYALFAAAQGVENARATITALRTQLQREDDITAQTGVVNTTKKYNLGKQIQQTEDARKMLFAEYKRLGGNALSMDAVKAPQDPCR